MVDAVRYPSLTAYLSRLPDGVDSNPECEAKGSMVRSALEDHDLAPELAHLPAPIAELVASPPPATRWVPLVHAEGIFHAVCDRFYPTDDAVLEWTYRRTMSMVVSPMYRRLATAAGPGFFLKMGARVHGLLERGTRVAITVDDKTARMELSHPPHVHSPLNHMSNVAMLRGVIEVTGGKNPRCHMRRSRPEGAEFDCVWE